MSLFSTSLPVWKTTFRHDLVETWHSEPDKLISAILEAHEHYPDMCRAAGEQYQIAEDRAAEARTLFQQNSAIANSVNFGKVLAVLLRAHDMWTTSKEQLPIKLEEGSISIPSKWVVPLTKDKTASGTEAVRTLLSYARARHVQYTTHATHAVLEKQTLFSREMEKNADPLHPWKTVGALLANYQKLQLLDDYYYVTFDARVLNRWWMASANEKTRMIAEPLTTQELKGIE